MIGGTHLVTLDGHRNTFNGRGEFSLICSSDNGSFTLQGRMTDIIAQEEESKSQVQSTAKGATVLTAVVAREVGADTVQFDMNRGHLQLFVNGQYHQIVAEDMQFRNVRVSSRSPNTLSATFKSGARLEARSTKSFLSSLLVSLSDTYQQSTKGLLGVYNGHPSDDILPRYSEVPLPLNSSLPDIHREFGLTCKDVYALAVCHPSVVKIFAIEQVPLCAVVLKCRCSSIIGLPFFGCSPGVCVLWFYGVTVSTWDSESQDPSLGRTFLFLFALPHFLIWYIVR